MRILSRQVARQSMSSLLPQAAAQLLGKQTLASAERVYGPEEFKVGSYRAGRVVYQGAVTDATGQRRHLEGYLGGILVDRFAFVFVGIYRKSAAETFRGGMNTLLRSFRGKAPTRNRQLESALVRCWEYYDVKSSTSFQKRMGLSADGSYWRTSSISTRVTSHVPGSGGVDDGSRSGVDSDGRERGEFLVIGNTMFFVANDGSFYNEVVELRRGILHMEGREWVECT